MRWILFSLLLLISMVIDEGNLLNVIAIGQWHIKPAVLITVLVFSTLNSPGKSGIACAFATGFAVDIAGAVMGPHMICYGIIGSVLTRFKRALSLRRFPHQMLVVFLTFLAAEFPAYLLSVFKTGEKSPYIFSILLLGGAYSAIAAPFIWLILRGLWPRLLFRSMGRSGYSR